MEAKYKKKNKKDNSNPVEKTPKTHTHTLEHRQAVSISELWANRAAVTVG